LVPRSIKSLEGLVGVTSRRWDSDFQPLTIEQADGVMQQFWNKDVKAWQTHWVPVFRRFAHDLVLDAHICPGQLVLDVGTGTGAAAFEAAKSATPGGFIVGIDRSERMLAVAKAESRKSERRSLRFLTMEGEHLLFPQGLFDAVISNCGISYASFHQTVAEAFRVLRKGGTFTFNDWHLKDVPAHRIFSNVLQQHKTRNPSRKLRIQRAAVATVERFGNRDMDLNVQLRELREVGFARVQVKRRKYAIVLRSVQQYLDMRFARVALKQELAELSGVWRTRLLNELRKELEQFVRNRRFKFDWEVSFVQAKRPIIASKPIPSQSRYLEFA
jgi:ubiquinone/menaquinone biosynthesis C-methylase UbiE